VTVTFSVTSPAGTPTGEVEVTTSSGGDKCSAPVSVGSCQITLTHSGDQQLTATYKGDETFASSSSAPEAHHVNEPPPPSNDPPTAAFSHADCSAGVACQFTDTSTDPQGNGTIVEWTWDFGDFSETSHEQNPSHVYTVGAGFSYDVTLTVKDDQGVTSTVQQQVVVQ
ncbi:MAG TPA: PKD domain-containing protein, partial [Gemmatimonadales bacterium]